jgi:biopolymer transport protein ExbB/TolQ
MYQQISDLAQAFAIVGMIFFVMVISMTVVALLLAIRKIVSWRKLDSRSNEVDDSTVDDTEANERDLKAILKSIDKYSR